MIEKVSLNFKCLDDIRSLQREGYPSVLTSVISVYLKQTMETINILSLGVRNEDYKKITNCAHKMKSSSAMIGAMKLSSLSRELEIAGRHHDLVVYTLFSQLESEYLQVEQILRDELKKMDGNR